MISRFIKNNFKIIVAISITAIICISGTVFATGYLAKDISYKREGTNIKNVEEALNELYSTNNVKLYDMRNKTTIIDNEGGNDSYNVKKINWCKGNSFLRNTKGFYRKTEGKRENSEKRRANEI